MESAAGGIGESPSEVRRNVKSDSSFDKTGTGDVGASAAKKDLVMNFEDDAASGSDDECTDKPTHSRPEEPEPTEELKRQVRALRKNQLDILKVDHWFYSQMHDLEMKASKMMEPLWKRRSELITGDSEPTDEEALFQIERENMTPEQARQIKREADKVAVGHFWQAIFENCDNLAMVTEIHDMDVLKYMSDIKVEVTNDPMCFKLHFYFMPNEYFTDSVLTKTYLMTNEIDPINPFIYDGTEITKTIGCKINWKEGKDVTKSLISKRQKHKQTGHIRNVEQVVDVDSFFTFFNPPEITDETSDEDRVQFDEKLKLDYRLGQFIRENLVPRATMYFTGEAQIIEEMFASSEEDTSEDDSEESDEEETDSDAADLEITESGDT